MVAEIGSKIRARACYVSGCEVLEQGGSSRAGVYLGIKRMEKKVRRYKDWPKDLAFTDSRCCMGMGLGIVNTL